MYLAQYTVGGVPWTQAAARLTYPRLRADRQVAWWDRFRALLRNLGAVSEASASLRVHLDDGFRAVFFATAPAAHADAFRRALGSLTQLGVMGGDVEYAGARAQHDAMLAFPPLQCRVALPALISADAWFAFDFRVRDHLTDLLSVAQTLGHAFSYHLNVEPRAIDPESQRMAAKNVLRVSQIAGVPPSLEQLQQRLADNLRDATHVCEELVGVHTADAAKWLHSALVACFRTRYGGSVRPDLDFSEQSYEGSLVATRHTFTFESAPIHEWCAAAVTADERVRLLSWQPSDALLSQMPAPRVRDDESLLGVAREPLPPPYMGSGPFAFVSYKREDLPRIAGPMWALSRIGHRLWYDKGIPGGVEWDALIEERVQSSDVLLVFLSQAAVQSKFVRREVKFADSLNKPIIAIRLDRDIAATDGLAMLFNQYQAVDASASFVPEDVDRALRSVQAT
jgi:TIR domain